MNILVIGQSGQVATSLADMDSTSPHNIICKGRPELDLTSPATVETAFDTFSPDIVINAAAYTAVDAAEDEPEQAYKINTRGSEILAELSASRNLPLIQISTDYVFDGSSNVPYSEDMPVTPLGVYGRSKAEGETAVANMNPHHLILRTAWVFSPFGKNFAKTMVRLAEANDSIRVVADQMGNPTYAPDIAKCIVSICHQIDVTQRADLKWGIYHMASEGSASWADFAQSIMSESQAVGGPFAKIERIATSQYPTRAKRPANSALNSDKLTRDWGVKLPHWKKSTKQFVASTISSAA